MRISDWSSDVCSSDLPVFADAPVSTSAPEERGLQNTDLACDSTEGVMDGTVVCKGNVTLQRGDQFLHAESLRFDSENSTYTADGNVRYQDSSMRMAAESANGDQTRDTNQIHDVRYKLIERIGRAHV